ncbi:MAG: hypothetical protein KA401_00610 [Anaerolineae bacterium]|nr:hypothetical protein [Anaerolineae bacterium]
MDNRRSGFWWKLIAYVMPFLLGFHVLTGALVYIGESMPLQWVVSLQKQHDDVLYRPMYGNRDLQFKIMSANARRAEVLAVGSSRILQFRAGFFNRNPDAFYNAAAPAWRLEQITDLLFSLDSQALPRVLILSIDPPWFNESYIGDEFPDPLSDLENLFLADRSILQDIVTRKDLSRPGFDPWGYLRRTEPGGSGGTALGMRAIRDGHGFRSDGSEQYGDFLVARWLWQPQMRDNHLGMLIRGEDMYVSGRTPSQFALSQLESILEFASLNEITVIGFLPSYAPSIWRRMMQDGEHTYITALTADLRIRFEAYRFPFFDFSDGQSTATPDEEFFDGWHASELSNLRLYIAMLQALPDVLGTYSDLDALMAIAGSSPDTWAVFGLSNRIIHAPG